MENPMAAGLIAGILGGIGVNIGRIIEAMLGLPTALPGMLTVETILYHLGYEVAHMGIFGAFCGIIYAKFFDAFPGNNIFKGFVFGVLLYLISNIYPSIHWIAYGWVTGFTPFMIGGYSHIYAGFFCLIPYGLVLGALYKR